MLEESIKNQLKEYLNKMVGNVKIIASLDGSSVAEQIHAFLLEVGATSDKIRIDFSGNYERQPSFMVTNEKGEVQIHFAALPLGHEFSSFVLAVLQASGYSPKITERQYKQIMEIKEPLFFETFMSLSCHNCPDVIQALNIMAALNSNVKHVAIDGAVFQKEVEDKQIMAVPTVYLNSKPFSSGRMELEEILKKIDSEAEHKDAEQLNKEAPFDVLIIGAGPAGSTAAIYSARKGLRVGLVAERFGGQTMDTLSIENYSSILETQGHKFSADLHAHVEKYGVTLIEHQRVSSLEPRSSKSNNHLVHLENGAVLRGKTIILATGAQWRNINVPGEKVYKNKGVAYCPHCDGPLFKGKDVAVIGGGNSGVEAAIDLAGIVKHVSVLEFNSLLKADAILVNKLRSLSNVSVYANVQTTEIVGENGKVVGLNFIDRESKHEKHLSLSGVFVQIGLVPNTEWLKNVVQKNHLGEIIIDEKCETSIPGVFAAGDATTVPYKQIIIASGEGAKAALGAFEYLVRNY